MNRPNRQSGNGLSIAHINTHDVAGGAAKVAWRLAQNQRNNGHNAKMIVAKKMVDSPHSISFPKDANPVVTKHCIENGQLFYQFQGSHKLPNHPLVKSADILHAHNLHGCYFNPFSLSALSHAKPVVWTLHDMQSFTPYDKSQARRKFGIPDNIPVIGAVAHGGALKDVAFVHRKYFPQKSIREINIEELATTKC